MVALGVPLGHAALAIPGVEAGLLFLAPALLLGAVLSAGRYPGERGLRIAAARWADRRRRRPASGVAVVSGTRRVVARVPRGGLVVAHHLAVRPPPGVPRAA